jgi:hypothetical protein
MSISGLLFQWTSTIKIQLSMLVKYKADLIISLKINLFSLWYSWKIAELVLNNNHSLTPLKTDWRENIFRFYCYIGNNFIFDFLNNRISIQKYLNNKISIQKYLNNRISVQKYLNNRISIQKYLNNRINIQKYLNNRINIQKYLNNRISIQKYLNNRISIQKYLPYIYT